MIRFQIGLGLRTPSRRLQPRDGSGRLGNAGGTAAARLIAVWGTAAACTATTLAPAALATLAFTRTLAARRLA